jgi:hypothetical protein
VLKLVKKHIKLKDFYFEFEVVDYFDFLLIYEEQNRCEKDLKGNSLFVIVLVVSEEFYGFVLDSFLVA